MRSALVVLALAIASGVAGAAEKTVTLAAKDMPLAAAARDVGKQAELRVVVGRACRDRPTTLDLAGVPARKALERLAEAARLKLVPLGKNAFWIGPPLEPDDKKVHETLLAARVDVNFQGQSLDDVLDRVRNETGLALMVDPEVRRTRDPDTLEVSMSISKIEARSFVAIVCESLNLDFDVRWGGVFLSTKGRLGQLRRYGMDPPPAGPMAKADAALRKRLVEKRVTFHLIATPVGRALQFLSTMGGFELEIEGNARDAMGEAEVTLKVANLTIRDALDAVLVPRGFLYRIEAKGEKARVVVVKAR